MKIDYFLYPKHRLKKHIPEKCIINILDITNVNS